MHLIDQMRNRARVVCRAGNPIDLADLDIVSLNRARAIIVVAPEGDDPDSSVIKTILAITNNPKRRPEPYHVVAEISNPKNSDGWIGSIWPAISWGYA